MEFHEKLQALRKEKGLTQEELAGVLYVSRTAVSKWESGRGYPNIDSLKAIAKFFGVTIDALLSGEEVLTIAEEDTKRKTKHVRNLVFGLLDSSMVMFFFLPFFGQTAEGVVQSVSLLGLTEIHLWLKTAYAVVVIGTVLAGVLTLALQNADRGFWLRSGCKVSLLCNVLAVLLFIVSRQPYAGAVAFIFSAIKAALLIKER